MRASFWISAGSRTVSSEEAVREDERERAGVDVKEGAPPVLARAEASAWDRADR